MDGITTTAKCKICGEEEKFAWHCSIAECNMTMTKLYAQGKASGPQCQNPAEHHQFEPVR
jgi:hypothetical protein